MRYLLDTCIYIYLSTDHASLHPDVLALLSEPDTLMCMSAESVPLVRICRSASRKGDAWLVQESDRIE